MSDPRHTPTPPQRSFASDLGRDMAESLLFALIQIAYWVIILGLCGFIGYQVSEGLGLLIGLVIGGILGGIGYLVFIFLGLKEAARALFKGNSR